jgi:hypothetical protein
MTETDMRSFVTVLRRALLMIVRWCEEWLDTHKKGQENG